MGISTVGGLQKTTNYRVVLPFYAYACVALLIAASLLFLNTHFLEGSYHNPRILAIVHAMALGWGTMIIFGASYQLLPVLIEGELKSDNIAYLTFVFMSIGIPVLIYGFYHFEMRGSLLVGAILVNLGVLFYFINVLISSFSSKKRNIHAWYIIVATIWLFSTTIFGLILVLNFNSQFLSFDSWHYLSIHAHLGIVGWFLLLIIGVGSRLIPMFLISKYDNNKVLWLVFMLINIGLISFIVLKTWNADVKFYFISILLILVGVCFFGFYIRKSYKVRIRRRVDKQVKTSIISIIQMLLPIAILLIALFFLPYNKTSNYIMLYGFTVFFGWITAIILGMTYKTLPFIVWNKVFEKRGHKGKTPAPKDLFNESIYHFMLIMYLVGFFLFIVGIILINGVLLKLGAGTLLIAAILYVINTGMVLFYKT